MTLRLAVALTGGSFDSRHWIDQVRQADDLGLDLATFDDAFGRHGPDAVQVAALVAPVTRHVGLVPVATTTHTEPFHLSTALATLDHISKGRAGWQVRVSTDPAEADLLGRRGVVKPAELIAEANDAVEVVRRLWDSWEDDAIIKDVATGRFIDRSKLHYIDFVGEHFAVKGPSIVPRSPQGQPVVAALAADEVDADLLFVEPDPDAVRRIEPGRKVFVDLPGASADQIQTWSEISGVDGVRVSEVPDISDLVVELQRRGLFQPSAQKTLRARLGLPVAVNRYAREASVA
ncbi:LLM class flavin-dependent oxidoreductase [Actinoplanes couchii]|uniref:FMNH2-utilizing oxygenase n=1 Tax=Actinoplanes couchii TaxID=403638 RepID=A0ABQ3XDD5_9ACTN|nr:LLM class flavin-dependent oxidoreductase [Actinoplanes couchii]MDR6321368.1 alkanesulfonate monooxygenase SsuD/methylene tetrahydromethanopterin reductase-like flavin-dependent oxidoreductase (luciferase family) [Actinoplanes couchii]GID56478.1 putative FMNH2-utilizing oxygenase [Actinoplanes couchii]